MEILNAFLNGYFEQKNAETGRSMVEILGVLAIIGVLSIGGIYGYTFAMDKYRANDIVYEVNLRANDVWHKYQEQPLPDPSEDGTDFDEFPDMTGTGYPIYMTSHPDVAFKTYVEGVSSRVCKNVVNMNLNGVVKGIQFVQVAQEDGDLVKYTGSASICGEDETDNTIVFTSFVDSDTEKSDDNQNQHCVEEEDCVGLCSPYTCDNNMTCRDKCYGLDDTPYCYDDGAGGQCVTCTKNEHCADYGDNYVCNMAEHTCQPVRQCVAGEYRAKSGGVCSLGGCQTNEFMNNTPDCVKCTPDSEPSSYINATYQLKMGHTATCGQCGNRQVLTVGSNNLQYCVPNVCLVGSEWQSANNGKCQLCQEDNAIREIGTEAVYRQQCEACNRVAFSQDVSGKTVWYCSKQAGDGYFIDSSGNIKNCSTAGDTQIVNTIKARNICEASGCNRVAQTNGDGTVWCMKE